jgi:peptide deformylase
VVVRAVLRLPHPVLSTRAEELDPTSEEAYALARDLVDTMRVSPGCVGLAATQIGVGLRAFAMDVTGHKKAGSCAGLVVLINPVVEHVDELAMAREGCMSVPDLTGNVVRAGRLVVRGLEPGGAVREIVADAIEARCVAHEVDHLDGLVFLDRVASKAEIFSRKRYLA